MAEIIADLQIHSKYSRATSKNLSVRTLAEGAKIKGIGVLGTGDCTHPAWLKELKENLKEVDNTGIYEFGGILWMITGEVSTDYEQDGKSRRVHHLFHVPSFEIADQINEQLAKHVDLKIDGRPMIKITSPEFVEILMSIDRSIMVTPAHAWTPWFGVFGSKSGFDSLEECYQDQIKNIFSLETGMSSDPAMNWRLSALDKITLVSNSDAHSANPWRLGREANVFDFSEKEITFKNFVGAVKNKDKKKFLYTVETNPNYGKYHFDGHRNCNFSCAPEQTKRLNGICPKCKKKLTVGVLNRVEQLADRPEGFVPKDSIPFKDLIPLYEIISFAMGVEKLYSQKVLEEQNKLIGRFGNEFNVLLKVERDELVKSTSEKIADAILKIREGKVKFDAGYDGVYGRPLFNGETQKKSVEQKSLAEFKK
jgi:uncharacterized protein (TIGR00375 family)